MNVLKHRRAEIMNEIMLNNTANIFQVLLSKFECLPLTVLVESRGTEDFRTLFYQLFYTAFVKHHTDGK